jgi:hypothetical protein
MNQSLQVTSTSVQMNTAVLDLKPLISPQFAFLALWQLYILSVQYMAFMTSRKNTAAMNLDLSVYFLMSAAQGLASLASQFPPVPTATCGVVKRAPAQTHLGSSPASFRKSFNLSVPVSFSILWDTDSLILL